MASMAARGGFACLCGRTFTQENAYSKHQKFCRKTKKRLSGALDKAKDLWLSNKRRRVQEAAQGASSSSTHIPISPMMCDGPGVTATTPDPYLGTSQVSGDHDLPYGNQEVCLFHVF